MKVLIVFLALPVLAWASHDLSNEDVDSERNERLYTFSCERAHMLITVEAGNGEKLLKLVADKKLQKVCKVYWKEQDGKLSWNEINPEMRACVDAIDFAKMGHPEQYKDSKDKMIDKYCLNK